MSPRRGDAVRTHLIRQAHVLKLRNQMPSDFGAFYRCSPAEFRADDKY